MYKQFRTILIVFLFNLLFLSQSYSQIIIDTDGSKEDVNQVLPYKVDKIHHLIDLHGSNNSLILVFLVDQNIYYQFFPVIAVKILNLLDLN